jgi:LmbE family N-acetylglucosaminyl deacetylase
MKNILIVGAHFDDAELGVGGTAAKLVKQGCSVYKLTLTDNITYFKQMGIEVDEKSSAEYSASACKDLGITEIKDFKRAPCNHLVYTTEMMQSIESIIFDKKIDTIFMHYTHDINQDHVAASKLCLTAGRYCNNVFLYHSNGYILDVPFTPTTFVDISDYLEIKKKALHEYKGAHNRFNQLFEICIAQNQIYGYGFHVKAAEGFVAVKALID